MFPARALTAQEIRNLDNVAIEQYGVPPLVLMENAGRCVAEEVRKVLKLQRRKEVSIFCGLGNNAGDGFVAARHLTNAGVAVKIFLIGPPEQFKPDAYTNFKILEKSGANILSVESVSGNLKDSIKNSSVIVDAIFGFGLNRDINEPFHSVIDFINHSKKKIVAVDIPSGLDATTGKIFGNCIKADVTVTFTFPKKGFYQNEGRRHVGKIEVVDIGVPKKLIQGIQYGRQ